MNAFPNSLIDKTVQYSNPSKLCDTANTLNIFLAITQPRKCVLRLVSKHTTHLNVKHIDYNKTNAQRCSSNIYQVYHLSFVC